MPYINFKLVNVKLVKALAVPEIGPSILINDGILIVVNEGAEVIVKFVMFCNAGKDKVVNTGAEVRVMAP